jgi:hypothetical protein
MASDIIKSREDFFRVLDEALAQILERLKKMPNFDPYQMIENELDAMKRWTAGGRTPTEQEREWVDIGVITIRELEPAETGEDYDFNNLLHELNYYFSNWPDDPGVAAEDPPL